MAHLMKKILDKPLCSANTTKFYGPQHKHANTNACSYVGFASVHCNAQLLVTSIILTRPSSKHFVVVWSCCYGPTRPQAEARPRPKRWLAQIF